MNKDLLYIDSHAHIGDQAFDKDRADIVSRLIASGTNMLVEIGCTPKEWKPAIELAEQYPQNIYACLGFHPIYANTYNKEEAKKLEQLLQNPKVVALGEIGLDYDHSNATQEFQREVFVKMLKFAEKADLPLVLHCRKSPTPEDFSAYKDLLNLIEKNYKANPQRKFQGILHCFSGRLEDAQRAIKLGFLIGVNSIIGYKGKKNDPLRQTIKKIGIENIVLETDCPYLPPQSKRGERNEPSFIPEIAQTVADVLEISLKEVAQKTTANTKAVYNIK